MDTDIRIVRNLSGLLRHGVIIIIIIIIITTTISKSKLFMNSWLSLESNQFVPHMRRSGTTVQRLAGENI